MYDVCMYNPNDVDGFPLELYAAVPWNQYLVNMVTDGTYSNKLTLQAAANLRRSLPGADAPELSGSSG